MSSRLRNDAGQMTVMLVGFFIVVAMMAATVTDASAAYLRRQSLNSLADGAALAAADGVQGDYVYANGLGDTAVIDPAVAQQYVADYLAAAGALEEYPDLTWVVDPRGDSVAVRVSTPLDLPFSPPGWDSSTRVEGESSAVVLVE